jgi:dTMP kinase
MHSSEGNRGQPAMRLGKNPKGLLVCFVGIDGAGKSTLARALTAIIEEQDVRCRYVWGGFNSSFAVFKPLVTGMKKSLFSGNKHMDQSRTKGRVLKSSRLSTVYQYLALSDYIIQGLVRIRLPLAFGTTVVCDRYIYDLTTSIGVLLDYTADRTLALLDRCLAFLPRPDLVFLIDLPEALAYQRKDDVISLDFLSVRRDIYLQMAGEHGMTILDGTSDPQELQELAAGKVLQYMAEER